MSTFRGTGVSAQAGAPHSPVMYNQPLGAHHPHSQHSPAIQNDTIVGKAMQTMFTSTEMFTPTVSLNASNTDIYNDIFLFIFLSFLHPSFSSIE